MQKLIYFSVLLCLLNTVVVSSQSKDKHVFIDVNVVDIVEEEILVHQDVFISGNTIEEIVPTEKRAYTDYSRIPSEGAYLIPGLMDAHAHLPGPQGLDMPMEDYLLMQLANGVTTLRCLRYEEDYINWKRKAEKELILSPKLLITTPAISVYGDVDYTNAGELFKSYSAQGYDHIKYLNGLNASTHRSLCKISRDLGLPFVGHLPRYISLKDAIINGQNGIEHFNGYMNYGEEDQMELDSLIQLTAANDVYNCPTIDWYEVTQLYIKNPTEVLNSRRGLKYLPDSLLNGWNNYLSEKVSKSNSKENEQNPRIDLLNNFKAWDAKLLVGPGDGAFIVPGFGMLEEMKLFKRGGLNNWEILRAACLNGHIMYDRNNMGLVRAKYVADLVLLEGNPLIDLENVGNIKGVMINGKWLDKKFLNGKLDGIRESRSSR